MKTLGLIGGLSWYSTVVYYKTINQLTNERLGGANSANLLLYSVNFSEFRTLQEVNDWNQIEKILTDIAVRLENAGAECIVMCTNTPHLVAEGVQRNIKIPLIHVAEVTVKEIVKQKIIKVGLLGTKFTMEHSFFKEQLLKHGIQVIIPGKDDRNFMHSSIFNELTRGFFKVETKNKYLDVIEKLEKDGAQGVIFGCTEINLLINQSDCNITVFDTALIHSKSAVDFSLSTESVKG